MWRIYALIAVVVVGAGWFQYQLKAAANQREAELRAQADRDRLEQIQQDRLADDERESLSDNNLFNRLCGMPAGCDRPQ